MRELKGSASTSVNYTGVLAVTHARWCIQKNLTIGVNFTIKASALRKCNNYTRKFLNRSNPRTGVRG